MAQRCFVPAIAESEPTKSDAKREASDTSSADSCFTLQPTLHKAAEGFAFAPNDYGDKGEGPSTDKNEGPENPLCWGGL